MSRPTEKQVTHYYKRVKDNYQFLIDTLQNAATSLQALLQTADKPVANTPSVLESVFDIALTVVAPQVMVLAKAYKMAEATKKLVEDAENVYGTMKAVKETAEKTTALLGAWADAAPSGGHATLGMIDTISGMHKRLNREFALTILLEEDLLRLLPIPGKIVDNLFSRTQWSRPPELLRSYYESFEYAFLYLLCREAVQRFVTFKATVYQKRRGPWSTNDEIATEFKPENISEASLSWMFDRFKKPWSADQVQSGVAGAPVVDSLAPVKNHDEMVTRWQPNIWLVTHPASGVLDMSGKFHKGKLTRLHITLDRRRRGLNAEGFEVMPAVYEVDTTRPDPPTPRKPVGANANKQLQRK